MNTNLDFAKFGIDVSQINSRATNAKTFCPQCRSYRTNKHDKSMSVNMQNGMFKCHYCGYSGCAAVPTESDKRQWMEQQPWYRPASIRKQKPDYRRPTPKSHAPMEPRALAWFAKRGISQSTLEALKVTEGEE